jgi:hypothetical protein
MAGNPVVPGQRAGELFIPSLNQTIQLVEWREGDFYDTIQTSASPTAGVQYEFFRDLSNKNLQHTNFKKQRNIPSGTTLIMTRIGVMVNQALGANLALDVEMLKILHAATLSFKINDRLITEGPLVVYPSGYGVTGSTTRTNTGVVTNGVPSVAAAPNLLVAQNVKESDDLTATVTFFDNSWITGGSSIPTFTNGPGITLFCHGLIKKPQGL